MTPREILIAARKLIEPPDRWTRGSLARNAEGYWVGIHSPNAVCWCMEGAVLLSSNSTNTDDVLVALKLLEKASGVFPSAYNDAPDRTHAEVLAAFDCAIQLAGDTK